MTAAVVTVLPTSVPVPVTKTTRPPAVLLMSPSVPMFPFPSVVLSASALIRRRRPP